MTNKNNEPKTEDLFDMTDLCAITAPTEEWEHLTDPQYKKKRNKKIFAIVCFAIVIAVYLVFRGYL